MGEGPKQIKQPHLLRGIEKDLNPIHGQDEAILFDISKSKAVTSSPNNKKFNADSMKIPWAIYNI